MAIRAISSRALRGDPHDRGVRSFHGGVHRPTGFALVEIVVALLLVAILAVLVLPRLVEATDTRQQTQLRNQIQILRTAISSYRSEHNNLPPGFPEGDPTATPTYETLVAQLTQYSDAQGRTSTQPDEQFQFGPYLDKLPNNPINNHAMIRLISTNEPFPNGPVGTEGWLYQPATGAIAANVTGVDPNGVDYFQY